MADLSRNIKIALLAGASAGCLTHQTASAQTAGTEAQRPRIEEVIVTARKREESVQTIPLAITAESGEALAEHQIADIYQVQNLTPSLQTQPGISLPGVPSFLIRGIGTAVFGITVESSVGIVVDDIPMARTQLANVQLYDIDRVEVLRGPQGMLFGKNAAAGLINIVTNQPRLGTAEFFSHLQYGNMNTPSNGNSGIINIGANLPFGDQAALRITGFYNHNDALAKNVFKPDQWLGQDMGGARARILWQPSDSIRFTLAGDYTRESGVGEGVQTVRSAVPNGSEQAVLGAVGITAGPNNTSVASNVPYDVGYEVWGTSLKAEFDIGSYTLTNVAGYRLNHLLNVYDADGLQVNFFDYNRQPNDSSQITEELRLTSPANQRFSYQAGLFYSKVENTASTVFAGALQGLLPPNPNNASPFTPLAGLCSALVPALRPNCLGAGLGSSFSAKSSAAFAEGQFNITDALHLTVGGRYTHDSLKYSNQLLPVNPPAGPVVVDLFAARGINPVSTDTTEDNWSYRGSLDYNINPDVMAYVSYSRGYKGPGFDALSGAVVQPEIPTDYELGLKSTLFDNHLRLNVAIFDEKFDGFQVQTNDPKTGVSQITNAGSLKSRGVEAEFQFLPTEGLTISGGVMYNSTKYDNLLLPCYAGAPTCMSFGPTNALQDVSGNSLAGSPDWTGTLTVRYEHPVWTGWRGFAQANGYFRSSYNLQANADPYAQVDASQIYGLSIGAQQESSGLGFSLFARNLTDKRTPTFIYSSPIAGMDQVTTGGVPTPANRFQQFGIDSFRMIGFTVDYRM